jgi:hypothetical protein
MNNVELSGKQTQQESGELIEGELIESNDDRAKPKKEPKPKKVFVPKSKEEIDKLSRREQYEYKIELSKFRTEELRNDYQDYKRQEAKTSRSKETRELIIWGRMIQTQVKERPDRRIAYEQLLSWMDKYLTKDRDRELLGFPPLNNSSGRENYDNN